jgi:colanic acid/amylovoran biosynthesis glycosyltransferase
MRIGYLVPEFPAQTHIFFWREVQALKRLGAEVHLLSTRRPQQASRHAFAAEAQKETHYLYPPQMFSATLYLAMRPLLLGRMLRYILQVEDTAILQKLRLIGLMLCAAELLSYARRHRIEHVHGHSCADAAHLLALASLSRKLPYSLTLHGDLPVYGTGHRAKFREARFVAVVTYTLQQQVSETCCLPLHRLPVIRMGVDVERFRPLEARTFVRGRLRLVTIARLAACKGHIFALKAMRQVIDQGLEVQYAIVGEGEHRPKIEASIRNLGLQSAVKMIGTASEDEVLTHLQTADAFVLSSIGLGEAAPVSVMEAMACGLPVISSIIGGTPELIRPQSDGFLIEQEDVTGLADAYCLLGLDTDLRQRMGIEARRSAEQKFSAAGFAQDFYQAIRISAVHI